MNDDELKRFEALERLVQKQTSTILEMRDTITTLEKRLKLKGRKTNRLSSESPDPMLISPAPHE